MSHINFAGSILQATEVQRQQAKVQTRQREREKVLARDVALEDDQLETQVESTEAPSAPRKASDLDSPSRHRRPKHQPGIDLTA